MFENWWRSFFQRQMPGSVGWSLGLRLGYIDPPVIQGQAAPAPGAPRTAGRTKVPPQRVVPHQTYKAQGPGYVYGGLNALGMPTYTARGYTPPPLPMDISQPFVAVHRRPTREMPGLP